MEIVTLGGRQFVTYWPIEAGMQMVDVTDPLHPHIAVNLPRAQAMLATPGAAFASDGSIVQVFNGGDKRNIPTIRRIPFLGLDADNKPTFDWSHPVLIHPGTELTDQKMAFTDAGVSIDHTNDDIYFGGMTAQFNEAIPVFFRGAPTGVRENSTPGETPSGSRAPAAEITSGPAPSTTGRIPTSWPPRFSTDR